MLWQIVLDDTDNGSGAFLGEFLRKIADDWSAPVVQLYYLEGMVNSASLNDLLMDRVTINDFAARIKNIVQIDWATLILCRDADLQIPEDISKNSLPAFSDGFAVIRVVDGFLIYILTSDVSVKNCVVGDCGVESIQAVDKESVSWPE